jgi:hypothetical protein
MASANPVERKATATCWFVSKSVAAVKENWARLTPKAVTLRTMGAFSETKKAL